MLGPTAHTDTFARDNLPPPDQWPDFRLDGLDYPDPMNAAVELTDRMVERGFGDHTALVGHGRRRSERDDETDQEVKLHKGLSFSASSAGNRNRRRRVR